MCNGKFWLYYLCASFAGLLAVSGTGMPLIALFFESSTLETSDFSLSLSDYTYLMVKEMTVRPTCTAIVCYALSLSLFFSRIMVPNLEVLSSM